MKLSTARILRSFAPLLFVALSAIFPASSFAAANFDGQTVSADYYWPDLSTLYLASGNAVVGPGVEFPNVAGASPSVDVSATNVLITYPAGWQLAGTGSFDGWVVSDVLNTIPSISGASLAGSDIPGMNNSLISFDANHVYVDTLGLGPWAAGSFISVDVQFVPEPASIVMFCLGGIGLVIVARKRMSTRA